MAQAFLAELGQLGRDPVQGFFDRLPSASLNASRVGMELLQPVQRRFSYVGAQPEANVVIGHPLQILVGGDLVDDGNVWAKP